MQRKSLVLVAVAVAILVAGPVVAQTATPWIHVEVTEDEPDGTRVNVNLPLSLVDVALDVLDENAHFHAGRFDVDLDHGEIDVEDIRRAWRELKAAGDNDFVTVEDGDEFVKVSRSGDLVTVEVRDHGDEEVRVEVPVRVVDALLSGEGDELDIRAAVEELGGSVRGDFVVVQDGRTRVRVWIDERE